jgi:hypothetical protein
MRDRQDAQVWLALGSGPFAFIVQGGAHERTCREFAR